MCFESETRYLLFTPSFDSAYRRFRSRGIVSSRGRTNPSPHRFTARSGTGRPGSSPASDLAGTPTCGSTRTGTAGHHDSRIRRWSTSACVHSLFPRHATCGAVRTPTWPGLRGPDLPASRRPRSCHSGSSPRLGRDVDRRPAGVAGRTADRRRHLVDHPSGQPCGVASRSSRTPAARGAGSHRPARPPRARSRCVLRRPIGRR